MQTVACTSEHLGIRALQGSVISGLTFKACELRV